LFDLLGLKLKVKDRCAQFVGVDVFISDLRRLDGINCWVCANILSLCCALSHSKC